MELKVTATVATGVAHPVADAVALALVVVVVDVAGLLDVAGGGVEPLPPAALIEMSAQVRYICGVWNEFHLKESKV